MKTKQGVKALINLGVILLAALGLILISTQLWAADSDGDGLDDILEFNGFNISSGFEPWVPSSTTPEIPGEASGLPIDQRLDSNRPDLFVIVRLASPSNLDPSIIEDYFEFASNPVRDGGLGFKVWVLRETGGTPPSPRQFTPASPQKAVLLVEDLDTISDDKQGVADYAGIMDSAPNTGFARFFSQRVIDQINTACAQSTAAPCKDASGALHSDSNLIFRHLQWVIIHEVMHVLFELDNSLRTAEGHHLTRGEYVMMPAVVFTEKRSKVTYHIPGEFSRTAEDNWQFYP